jgi:polysaccharide export outer membrane protein
MTTRWLVLVLVALSGCGAAPVYDYDYAKEPDPRRSEFVIGVADRLAIKVWKNADLSTEVVVRPDGTITMPLIGDLRAAGRTPTELRAEITQQLAKFVRDEGATVTVAVTGVQSYSFTVSGNVEKPGVFKSEKYVTVLEAVQLAGGPNRYASPSRTRIFRQGKDGQQKTIPVNISALEKGEHLEMNLALYAGDQVYVP